MEMRITVPGGQCRSHFEYELRLPAEVQPGFWSIFVVLQ
jgi:hypothetical protein